MTGHVLLLLSTVYHPAEHFIWKLADSSTDDVDEENAKIVSNIRKKENQYFSRASRRVVKSIYIG